MKKKQNDNKLLDKQQTKLKMKVKVKANNVNLKQMLIKQQYQA